MLDDELAGSLLGGRPEQGALIRMNSQIHASIWGAPLLAPTQQMRRIITMDIPALDYPRRGSDRSRRAAAPTARAFAGMQAQTRAVAVDSRAVRTVTLAFSHGCTHPRRTDSAYGTSVASRQASHTNSTNPRW